MTVRSRTEPRGSLRARSKPAKVPRPSSAKARSGARTPVQTRVVLVTGMSGAGRSSALKTLEDLGYEAVDNLPISLLSRIVRPPAPGKADARGAQPTQPRALAIGVDIRTRDFGVEPFLEELHQLIGRRDLGVELLFLDSSDDTLLRRYTETRRRHPLAVDRPVHDGIAHERRLLERLRAQADRVIDTSDLSAADLRRLLDGAYRLSSKTQLAVCVTSFSYRQGVPREADLVFDVRFLRNPHYVLALKPHTGLDSKVGDYVASDPGFDEFYAALTHLLEVLLPRYEQEGKSYLTIAIGCTGGRHRSVYIAERLAQWLRVRGPDVAVIHRDITEDDVASAARSAALTAGRVAP
jgi:RNase adapter protein RapZ